MKISMATESSPIASRRSLRERAKEREREREGGEVVETENIGVMDRQQPYEEYGNREDDNKNLFFSISSFQFLWKRNPYFKFDVIAFVFFSCSICETCVLFAA